MERQFDRYTVRGLRNLARERELRRYSRLRRNELITLLINTDTSPILDRDLGTFVAPILQPTIAQPLPPTSKQRPTTSVNDLLRSLENVQPIVPSISPEIKALKDKINKIFSKVNQIKVIKNRSSLKNYAEEYKIPGIPVVSPDEFFALSQPSIIKVLREKRGTKVKMVLQCIMKRGERENEEKVEANFSSEINEINLVGTNEMDLYLTMLGRILENFINFLQSGSGWAFHSVKHLKLHFVVYEPLRASSYLPLPDWIANKKACINMKNEDEECFTWSILRHFNLKEKNNERVDNDLKSKKNSLNMKGINYPVSLQDIDKFERQNKTISVNVFGIVKKKKIKRIRAIKSLRENHVNLLYIEDKEEKKSHYVLIKDGKFNALLRAQVSDHSNNVYCMLCMNHFGRKELLDNHMKRCENYNGVDIKLPKFDSKNPEKIFIKFENYCRKIMVPFVVIADFECVLQKNKTKNIQESNTIETQKHIPVSYNYLICSFNRNVLKPVLRGYVGKDAEKHFIDTLTKDTKQLYDEFYKNPVKIKIIEDEVKKHKNEEECWICGGKFIEENPKVKDHCHFTGEYRGAACNTCNLKAKVPNFIPVFFHNLSGYDAHIFVKYLGKTNGNIDCIPITEEKYISFTKHLMVGKKKIKIRFLDSFKFLAASLDKLAENLKDENFKKLIDYLEKRHGYTEEKLKLLRRKGVFPYEWLDSFEKLEEIKLPPKDAFYSSLNGEHIESEDYEHALRVFDVFECKTIKDFLQLYNETDVLLLADVIENFRFSIHKEFNLDPAWYYTLPGYAWDAMLKVSEIKLEKLTDINMLNFFEGSKRGMYDKY